MEALSRLPDVLHVHSRIVSYLATVECGGTRLGIAGSYQVPLCGLELANSVDGGFRCRRCRGVK